MSPSRVASIGNSARAWHRRRDGARLPRGCSLQSALCSDLLRRIFFALYHPIIFSALLALRERSAPSSRLAVTAAAWPTLPLMSASRHLALPIPPPTALRGAAQPSPTTTATSSLRSSAPPRVTVAASWASLRPSGCGHSAVGSMLCAVRVPSHALSRRRAGCVGSLRGGAALTAPCRLPVHRMGRSRARAARRDGDRARCRLPRRVGPAAALVP